MKFYFNYCLPNFQIVQVKIIMIKFTTQVVLLLSENNSLIEGITTSAYIPIHTYPFSIPKRAITSKTSHSLTYQTYSNKIFIGFWPVLTQNHLIRKKLLAIIGKLFGQNCFLTQMTFFGQNFSQHFNFQAAKSHFLLFLANFWGKKSQNGPKYLIRHSYLKIQHQYI